MKNINLELIAKARATKSVEELLELAKANNIELTEKEAKTYFAQLNANGAVSDDELDIVSGGKEEEERSCWDGGIIEERKEQPEQSYTHQCPHCREKLAEVEFWRGVCPVCRRTLKSI